MAEKKSHILHAFDYKRDSYGFTLRPQHVQTYREYAASIYKEEEEERSYKWKNFLDRVVKSSQSCPSIEGDKDAVHSEGSEQRIEASLESHSETEGLTQKKPISDDPEESDPVKELQERVVPSSQQCASDEEDKDLLHSESGGKKVESSSENLKEEADSGDRKPISIDPEESVLAEDLHENVVQSFQQFASDEGEKDSFHSESSEQKVDSRSESCEETEDSSDKKSISDDPIESHPAKDLQPSKETEAKKIQTWTQTRDSLSVIETMMSFRLNKGMTMKDEKPLEEAESLDDDYRECFEVEAGVIEISDCSMDTSGAESYVVDEDVKSLNDTRMENDRGNGASQERLFPLKEELEFLVHGGVPKDLRGEVWQAFVGVKTRQLEKYYQDLLSQETDTSKNYENDSSGVPRKWKRQIEKDIPRTFPGHPALDENGRNSLRRLLLAYALHNPSVGYCQAMNFFAGILLLLMPEENAFWTLVGILDDYFNGYYTEEMIESQVDQLVFEELMREKFPKLVNHLDYLGVQVAWISGPWFLSIFVNILPWESVLRIWDVLLFEGNRVMLFRTALALMELYGPTLVTTKDAGDAITLLQSLTGSTFDSSQLVLTACMGFLAVTEGRLQELREKHRPSVLVVVEERTEKGQVWKDSKGLASKLYSFKHDPGLQVEEKSSAKEGDQLPDGDDSNSGSRSSHLENFLNGETVDPEEDSLPDLQEQVDWMKVELCRLLEEKRSSVLRAEELETALMEMVKADNRLQLSARVEQLEQEVADLKQALADEKEQEAALLQILMRVEQEQKITENARLSAEQDVAAHKYAVHVLQEKYDKAVASLADMEKRVVMAESMLEATLQYESGQVKAVNSPRSTPRSSQENRTPRKMGLLPFSLGWRDRNKGKPTDNEKTKEHKPENEGTDSKTP